MNLLGIKGYLDIEFMKNLQIEIEGYTVRVCTDDDGRLDTKKGRSLLNCWI